MPVALSDPLLVRSCSLMCNRDVSFRGRASGNKPLVMGRTRVRAIDYVLTFNELEGEVRQAHIHMGHPQNQGNIVLWLCETQQNQNPNTTAPTPSCLQDDPSNQHSGRVTGTLTAADIIVQTANGVDAATPEEFAQVISLIKAAKTYVNVRTAPSSRLVKSAANSTIVAGITATKEATAPTEGVRRGQILFRARLSLFTYVQRKGHSCTKQDLTPFERRSEIHIVSAARSASRRACRYGPRRVT